MKVIKPQELRDRARFLRLLVYGEPGSGKSWLCASAALHPSTSPCLYLSYRGQVESLYANPAFQEAMEDHRLILVEINQYKDLVRFVNWVCGGKDASLASSLPFPKTLVIDSLTEVQRSQINRIAGNEPDKLVEVPERPQIQHWGQLLEQMMSLAYAGRRMRCHFVGTLLQGTEYTGKGDNRVSYRTVALQGQSRQEFPGQFLSVMRLYRVRGPLAKKAYNVGTFDQPGSLSKDQSGFLRGAANMAGPSIPKLVALLPQIEEEAASEQANE